MYLLHRPQRKWYHVKNIEEMVKAAGQNIKRLLNYNNRWNPKHPTGGALLYFSLRLIYWHRVARVKVVGNPQSKVPREPLAKQW
jgi:hypothetical protein